MKIADMEPGNVIALGTDEAGEPMRWLVVEVDRDKKAPRFELRPLRTEPATWFPGSVAGSATLLSKDPPWVDAMRDRVLAEIAAMPCSCGDSDDAVCPSCKARSVIGVPCGPTPRPETGKRLVVFRRSGV